MNKIRTNNRKILPDPLPKITKITRLVKRFLLRTRNMASSKIHCYYIIINIDFKEKHTLEQDELLCCAITSFGLKENM